MWSKLLVIVVVLPTIILAGCATTPSYQAKAFNRSDGALVCGWKSGGIMFFTRTGIEKVEGQRLSTWSQVCGGCLIDPGMRVLSVVGTYAGGFAGVERYTGRVELTATLNAGHIYQVKAERSGTIMTFWVEDKQTHEAASERQSTNTTHWINWL